MCKQIHWNNRFPCSKTFTRYAFSIMLRICIGYYTSLQYSASWFGLEHVGLSSPTEDTDQVFTLLWTKYKLRLLNFHPFSILLHPEFRVTGVSWSTIPAVTGRGQGDTLDKSLAHRWDGDKQPFTLFHSHLELPVDLTRKDPEGTHADMRRTFKLCTEWSRAQSQTHNLLTARWQN